MIILAYIAGALGFLLGLLALGSMAHEFLGDASPLHPPFKNPPNSCPNNGQHASDSKRLNKKKEP